MGYTPMMKQYLEIKDLHRDCILFFRLGDFYEMFFEDARTASRELELTLTGKDCGMEKRADMCGVPYHAAEGYISKLVDKGYKVAICEQMSDPKESKGIVERDVVRVITPGTQIQGGNTDGDKNIYIMSICWQSTQAGLCIADVSTGEFQLKSISDDDISKHLMDEIIRWQPKEILTNDETFFATNAFSKIKTNNCLINCYTDDAYEFEAAKNVVLDHFKAKSLPDIGCQSMEISICAAGAMLTYLKKTQKNALEHINKICILDREPAMALDTATRRNLELTQNIRGEGKKGTLLWLLDHTMTAMGGRCLRKWIEQPLQNARDIEARLDAIEELKNEEISCSELRVLLDEIYDLERLSCKIAYGSLNARDCLAIVNSLSVLPRVKEMLCSSISEPLKSYGEALNTMDDLQAELVRAIAPEPPLGVKEGGIINGGFSSEIDSFREAINNGKTWIKALEDKEKKATDIKNLKIGFNKVFGYYIEVTKSYYHLIPYRYIRKQTLANCERFITPELKEMEEKILGAEEKSIKLEYELFCEIREQMSKKIPELQEISSIIAAIDAMQSMAVAALRNNYTKPRITDSGFISIKSGRHPVVEKTLGGQFVTNDVYLDMDENRFLIITGPNMAGKSTFMRQVALITLMAHIGSFVPAQSAEICLTDRIFTRVGASDDLFMGQSTFMVEMSELANIIRNASKNSLIILDEIGRGTGTLDGLGIAWASVEHIADTQKLGAKTLFSTHYHELSELEGFLPGVVNYHVTVKEYDDDIIFLRKLLRGGTDRSFGVHVAKLAGLPDEVLKRADELMKKLQEADINRESLSKAAQAAPENVQMSLLTNENDEKLLKYIRVMDADNLTPREALETLYLLKQMAGEIDV